MPTRCAFFAAAGPRIGFGHVMRVRALAGALGVKPVVVLRGGITARRAARRLGVTVVERQADPIASADLLVVDDPSPRHTRAWLRRARRRGVPAVAVCDRAPESLMADLVVDGSISSLGRPERARTLSGPQFYLLDSRVTSCRAGTRRRRLMSGRVLIALGGGHQVLWAAGRLVEAIRRVCPQADIRVACGFAGGNLRSLRGARWLTAQSDLLRELASSDVAVVAGGVTLYEACALGIPAVTMAVVGPQRAAVRSFVASGAVLDGGWPPHSGRTAERTALHVRQLLTDAVARRRLSVRARQLVDGRGAVRVARHIHALMAEHRRERCA